MLLDLKIKCFSLVCINKKKLVQALLNTECSTSLWLIITWQKLLQLKKQEQEVGGLGEVLEWEGVKKKKKRKLSFNSLHSSRRRNQNKESRLILFLFKTRSYSVCFYSESLSTWWCGFQVFSFKHHLVLPDRALLRSVPLSQGKLLV